MSVEGRHIRLVQRSRQHHGFKSDIPFRWDIALKKDRNTLVILYKRKTPESPANAESNENGPARFDVPAEVVVVELEHDTDADRLRLLVRTTSAHCPT